METKKRLSLGKILSLHRRYKLSWFGFGALALIGSSITLGPLFYGMYRYYFGYTKYGPIAASAWSQSWYRLTLLGLVIFGILTLDAINRSRRFVAIHENGVHIRTNKTITIPWQAIRGLSHNTVQHKFLKLALKPTSQAYLFLENGIRIQLDHQVEDLDILLAHIRKAIYPIQYAKIQESFYSGEWVEFGMIKVHLFGIRIQGREIPWRLIRKMSITSGFLVVELANLTQVKMPVIKISNLELLLQIVQAGVHR